jgi:hypothetical protein
MSHRVLGMHVRDIYTSRRSTMDALRGRRNFAKKKLGGKRNVRNK